MTKPDTATKRRLAVEASCDLRTIQKAFDGEPIRGLAGHRARAVLKAAGYDVPEPTAGPAKEPRP
jgi:hypothetical protein